MRGARVSLDAITNHTTIDDVSVDGADVDAAADDDNDEWSPLTGYWSGDAGMIGVILMCWAWNGFLQAFFSQMCGALWCERKLRPSPAIICPHWVLGCLLPIYGGGLLIWSLATLVPYTLGCCYYRLRMDEPSCWSCKPVAPKTEQQPKTDHDIDLEVAQPVEAAPPELMDLSGTTEFRLSARICTRAAAGTIVGKSFEGGVWRRGQRGGQGKMLFLRNGQLCFDIGWVGCITADKLKLNDGKRHTVGVEFADGAYHLLVDERERVASGLRAVPDDPDTAVVVGDGIGHHPPRFDMAPRFEGTVTAVQYSPLKPSPPAASASAGSMDSTSA